jgi:hypothetical protein
LRALADAIEHNWSRLVLNYDLRQQVGLARGLVSKVRGLKDFERRSLRPLWWAMPGLLLPVAWSLWRRRKKRAERLLSRYRSLLAKAAGVDSLPDRLGLYELAEASNEPLCREFAEIYGGALYRDRELSAAAFRQLQEIVKQLKQRLPAIRVALPTPLGDNGDS